MGKLALSEGFLLSSLSTWLTNTPALGGRLSALVALQGILEDRWLCS
jgi:hypothetical protein